MFRTDQRDCIPFFYLRGGFDFTKLVFFDRLLMTLLKMKLKRKKVLSADERGMPSAYNKPVDFTRRENIRELVAQVEALRNTF